MHQPRQPDSYAHVRRHFKGTNGAFSAHHAVFENISQRLFDRLALLAIEPQRVLDLGARDGYQTEGLRAKYPGAEIIAIDPAIAPYPSVRRWWRRAQTPARISADPHHLPFADGSFDLVVSNMLLPWCHEPTAVYAEVARVLAENGAFMLTSAGPDTLVEYSDVWRELDSAEHVFGLADMHNIGDALLSAGFAAPVLDRELITVDYPSIDALQTEMRNLGAGNIAIGRRTGLMSALVRKQLREAVSAGRFSVTLELVHAHGWKGALLADRNNNSDEYSVSLDSLRQSLRGQ